MTSNPNYLMNQIEFTPLLNESIFSNIDPFNLNQITNSWPILPPLREAQNELLCESMTFMLVLVRVIEWSFPIKWSERKCESLESDKWSFGEFVLNVLRYYVMSWFSIVYKYVYIFSMGKVGLI